jgi:hypothetical protein
MINKIFWDIDETLISTSTYKCKDLDQKSFTLKNDLSSYYTVIRPNSQRLIDFSRELVGEKRVFILTTSTNDYANTINEIAGWGFASNQIISREMLKKQHPLQKLWREWEYTPRTIKSSLNVLIDNLPSYDNYNKMQLIGIERHLDRYLKIDDYYGEPNHDFDVDFESDVKLFLESHYRVQV